MKVFVTRDLPEEALALLRESDWELDIWPEETPPSYAELKARTADCEGLLCLLTDRIDSELLEAAPRLRVVSQMAVGVDNIDIAVCTQRKIPVGHTPGVLTEATADLAFGLLVATARRIVEAELFTRKGSWRTWSPMLLTGPDVHHSTLGIFGMGRIGYEMARRAHGFQMRLLYTSRRQNEAAERDFGAKRVSLETLLQESDFLSLHAPSTPETHHLIGKEELAQMKTTAILINTSRGNLVDQAALTEALQNRRLAAAGLDVFEKEPLSVDDPLLTLKNVVLTPHIGSASTETRTKMAVLAARNLIAGLRGEPLLHVVNPA